MNSTIKLLLVGDFHGEVPDTLRRKLLSINVDACLCVGDLCKAAERRRFFLNHFHELRQGRPPADIFRLIPAKTHISDMESMQVVIDFLGELQVPVFLVPGNVDYLAEIANILGHKINKPVLEKRISAIENLHLVEKKAIDFLGHQILGYSGPRICTGKTPNQMEESSEKELEELSLKVINWRRVIFLAHWPPYKTLDRVDNTSSPFYGEHWGLEFFLHFIRKRQPLVFACGHVHEQQGKAVIGETLVINPGCAQHGQAAILTLSSNKITDLNFIR